MFKNTFENRKKQGRKALTGLRESKGWKPAFAIWIFKCTYRQISSCFLLMHRRNVQNLCISSSFNLPFKSFAFPFF